MKATARARAPTLAFAFALAFALAAGCTSAPALPTGPVNVHLVHRFSNTTADSFGIPADAGLLHVTVILENFYRNRCPAPIAEVALQSPSGAVKAHLKTEDLPTSDCVYTYEKNETLEKGYWTVRYSGGTDSLGSIVDIRPATTKS